MSPLSSSLGPGGGLGVEARSSRDAVDDSPSPLRDRVRRSVFGWELTVGSSPIVWLVVVVQGRKDMWRLSSSCLMGSTLIYGFCEH